jgi:hypothetical protein
MRRLLGLVGIHVVFTCVLSLTITVTTYCALEVQSCDRPFTTYLLMWLDAIVLRFGYLEFHETPFARIFVFSSLVASLWALIYGLCGLLIRLIAQSNAGVAFLRRVLKIEEEPLLSLGYVAMAVVTCAYLLAGFALIV